MPVYEYQCDECGQKFDLFLRSVKRESTPVCPHCGSEQVHKAISLFGVGNQGSVSASGGVSCGSGPV
jgi:putative FmdB family regulatory protein